MKMKRILAAGAALLSLVAFAKTDSHFTNTKGADIAYNSKGDIVRGEWTSQFTKAMKQGKAEGVPVVVFWANHGCSHCAATEVELCTSKFKKWMTSTQLYMVFSCGGYPGPCGNESVDAKAAAKDASGQFPYIAVYWNQKKSSFKGVAEWKGTIPLGTFTGNGVSADGMIKKIEAMLGGYSPCVGGWFVYGSDVTDKLDDDAKLTHHYEAEKSTTKITLQLKRGTKNLAAGTDQLVVYKPDGTTVLKKYTVSWAKGAKTTEVVVSVKDVFTKAGQKVKAVMNGKTEKKYTAWIYYANRGNSASNPDFKGCTKFGNWTMDVDAAKAYAKANNGYTLVGVLGSLWCHDCANTDRNFLDQVDADGRNRFQTWAKSKKVALVTVDVPNFSGSKYSNYSSPCLLSKKRYSSHLAYEAVYGFNDVTRAGASKKLNADTMRSGLAFLSRKMITDSEATAKLKAFHNLAYLNTNKGGFHRYFDDKTEDGNANRTGVPIFVLLDKSGKVVARFTDFASTSPVKADRAKFDDYLKRFDEMLAIADNKKGLDNGEIENNRAGTASAALVFDSVASNRLCAADTMDTFLLSKDGNVKGSVQLKALDTASRGATVSVQFLQEKDGVPVAVGDPANLKLDADFTAAATNEFTEAGKCYVKVSAAFKGSDSKANNFIAYAIASSVDSVIPLDTKVTVTANELVMTVVTGQVYRLSGIAAAPAGFEEVGEGLYRWTAASGKATLTADASGSISYQKWNPGKVGFKSASESMTKKLTKKTVSVVRQGGVSGTVGIKVSLDAEKSTFYYDVNRGSKDEPRFEMTGAKDGVVELTWKEGDSAAKTVTIAIEKESEVAKWYGDGAIALVCEPVDCDAGRTNYVLTVKESGEQTKSTVSIAGVEPAPTEGTTVYARRGEGAVLTLARSQDGYYGAGTVAVQSDNASVKFLVNETAVEKVLWGERDYEDKPVTVSGLPSAGKSVTVSIAKKSLLVDASASSYTIVSVDDKAPEFEKSKLALVKTVRYAPVYEKVGITSVSGSNGTLGYEIMKGELPSGVTARVSGDKLVLSGTVKAAAGSYKVYFRATETVGTKVYKGMPLYVAFKVVDPVTVSASDKTYGNLVNTAIKTARTVQDVPVYGERDEVTRLFGTVTVTIPATGKVSAKYSATNRSKPLAFSANRWEKKAMDDKDGTLTAVPTTTDADGYEMSVSAKPNGVIEIIVVDPRSEAPLSAVSVGTPWSDANSAKKYRGDYTATMVQNAVRYEEGRDPDRFVAPAGAGYVCLTMTSKTDYDQGVMKWAGMLPDGTDFSGSAVLSPGKTKTFGTSLFAYLPVIFRGAKDDNGCINRFATVLAIKKGAADDATTVKAVYGDPALDASLPVGLWQHIGGTPAAKTSYDVDLLVYGSYWDPAKDLIECCGGKTTQYFCFDNENRPYVQYALKDDTARPGEVVSMPSVKFRVSKSSLAITGENPCGLTVANGGKPNASGVVSGTVTLSYFQNGKSDNMIKANWKGVILPGWGFCNCGESAEDVQDLPFVCAGYWFVNSVPYNTERGWKGAVEIGGSAVYSSEAPRAQN